jgi:hypothetical protein
MTVRCLILIKENEGKPTVFSEWEDCDCNQCGRYWDSSCDGVKKDKKKPCNQFVATRSVIIPEQIKRLQKVVKGLVWAVTFISVSLLLHYLGVIF